MISFLNARTQCGNRNRFFVILTAFMCRVNGKLLVGKAYNGLLDLRPGDEFDNMLGRKQIRLIPAGVTDE